MKGLCCFLEQTATPAKKTCPVVMSLGTASHRFEHKGCFPYLLRVDSVALRLASSSSLLVDTTPVPLEISLIVGPEMVEPARGAIFPMVWRPTQG